MKSGFKITVFLKETNTGIESGEDRKGSGERQKWSEGGKVGGKERQVRQGQFILSQSNCRGVHHRPTQTRP